MTTLSPQLTASPLHQSSDWAIDLQGVEKIYKGKVHALRGIEMRVKKGEVFGLLGPNGAGKSTLIKILMTVISPTAATGTMLGMPVGHKPTLARVGYLPEHHRFPEYLTGAQVLDFYAALSGVPSSERKARRGPLLDLVGMGAWGNKPVRGYSKGMRQRIGIAQALMNNPDLILLDEPTDGVDPVGRREIREVLQRLRDEGKTIFLNSHLLSELEMLCDRVAIMVQGRVVSQGTIPELTEAQARYEVEFWLDEGEKVESVVAGALPEAGGGQPAPDPSAGALAPRVAWSGTLTSGELFSITRTGLVLGTSDPRRVQPIIDRLRAGQVVIRTIRQVRPSLEDLFMQAVTDPNTGQALKPGAKGN
jgi:ABC-2 type transport system ATP-binding protein